MLEQFGSQLLVPFGVRAMPAARVLWLNQRWLTRNDRQITEASVLEQFAISTPGERTVHADRYGDPRGTSPHGGSGRVATLGEFQVKGIGPTPLVGDATWIHSHGHMSLTEAICEAIFGEILDQELPFGAVPAIAIIDSGEIMKTPQGELHRAMIVRPAPLRPAHLLRAASFVPRGLAVTPSPDATRVREVITHLASMRGSDLAQLQLPRDIEDMLDRLSRQAATADALRLFTGGLFASNVSLTGAILDFGVARALYSWASLQIHAHARGFGHDVERLVNFATAIQFYARKAGRADAPWFRPAIDRAKVHQCYRDALRGIFGQIWSDELLVEKSRQAVRDVTERYFEQQQQIKLREIWSGERPKVDWIHDQLSGDQPPPIGLASIVNDIVRPYGRVVAEQVWRGAARLFLPRAELDRSRLERRVARVLRDTPAVDLPACIGRLIEGTIGRCRRWWPNLPVGTSVISQRVLHGCSALDCSNEDWWLEGLVCGARLVWGEFTLTDAQIKKIRPTIRSGLWYCRVERADLPAQIAAQLTPKPHLRYSAPPAWWAGTT